MWSAAASPPQHLTHLHRETLVPVPLPRAFAFFADAANLERLTPPWLRFEIRTPMPVVMRPGVEIAYRLHLYGIPIRWVSVIDVWEPGERFIDRQISGRISGGGTNIASNRTAPRRGSLTTWSIGRGRRG